MQVRCIHITVSMYLISILDFLLSLYMILIVFVGEEFCEKGIFFFFHSA